MKHIRHKKKADIPQDSDKADKDERPHGLRGDLT
jgi:hypothetical protein